jgi:hypothetical protein
MDWMYLVQEGDQWWALVTVAMNLRFDKGRKFLH